ncbi:MAG: DEAD/DEAH box helicase, partial [Mycobacteriales bacterium]
LRELIDSDALTEVEAELQRLTPERAARHADDVSDMLRFLGDLTTGEAARRGATPRWLADLEETRRAIRVRIGGEERWLAIEDAGRVRDALGVPLPVGVPETFLEIVRDPVGDLVGRFARTHGPFHVADVAARLGLGSAVVTDTLQRLAVSGRVVHGEFRPGGSGMEWCDAEVLRSLRRRSLAKLRKEVEPAPLVALARFLPAWQSVGAGAGRGLDSLVRAIEQLQGAAVPASALERLVLPARVADYAPAMLDELCATGEVVWAGQGALGGHDGWISLHLADNADLMLAPPDRELVTALSTEVLSALDGGAALFFRSLSERVDRPDDAELISTLWDLVWAGLITNDTLAPLRARLGSGRGSRRTPPRIARGGRRRPALPSRLGPPAAAGRWTLLPARSADETRRYAALADVLLDRHGIVTRGAVQAEHVRGGFAAVYPVLKAMEEAGKCRRGYFVESLGGAQFAMPGAVDRMRTFAGDRRDDRGRHALVLAATDPANPYGAALPWPERPLPADGGKGHRPGRKAEALVLLVDGALVLYVERGGKSLLSWTEDVTLLQPAVDALALAVRDGSLGPLAVERADGESVHLSTLGVVLEEAGFRPTPRGLRLRA